MNPTCSAESEHGRRGRGREVGGLSVGQPVRRAADWWRRCRRQADNGLVIVCHYSLSPFHHPSLPTRCPLSLSLSLALSLSISKAGQVENPVSSWQGIFHQISVKPSHPALEHPLLYALFDSEWAWMLAQDGTRCTCCMNHSFVTFHPKKSGKMHCGLLVFIVVLIVFSKQYSIAIQKIYSSNTIIVISKFLNWSIKDNTKYKCQ